MSDDVDAVEVLLFEITCSTKSNFQKDFDKIEQLKAERVHCTVHYLLRKDIFAVLPNGFGKSIFFQIIPSVCLLSARRFDHPKSAILVIVCTTFRLSVGFSNQFQC